MPMRISDLTETASSRWSERQQRAVESLKALPERHGEPYVLDEFKADPVGRSVVVSRYYGPPFSPRFYFEVFIVGPRGAITRKSLQEGTVRQIHENETPMKSEHKILYYGKWYTIEHENGVPLRIRTQVGRKGAHPIWSSGNPASDTAKAVLSLFARETAAN